MPISTTCPSCKALFRLPDELAGRKVKCQKCQGLFVVPAGDTGTLEPGMRVPEESGRMAVENAAVEAKGAPTRLDDIPVLAQFAHDDDDDDDRRAAPKPRRSERRLQREKPKPRSVLLPIVLALLGLGVFACILVGGFAAVWHLAMEEQQPRKGERGQRQRAFRPGNFKNGNGDFNGAGGRAPNVTPTIELKLDPSGSVRVESELAPQDDLNPDGRRHKHYAIQMEEGKRYQIDMKVPKTLVINARQNGAEMRVRVKQFDALLLLFDDANKLVAENDDVVPPPGNPAQPHNQDSQIIFTAPRTAIYKIEATFCDNDDGLQTGDFILTVKRLPN